MLQPRIISPFRRALIKPSSVCIQCQHRALAPATFARPFTSAPLLRRPAADPKAGKPQPPPPSSDDDVFVPQPLGRPIGFPQPPQPGENTSEKKVKRDYTGMSLSQRNLAKRADIVEKWGTSYFRDFKNIRKYRSGKTFMANARIFKKDAALFFPNFHGDTLEGKDRDTTTVLREKISVVKVYSSEWGNIQVQTFASPAANPELHALLAEYPSALQIVDVNIEENSLKAWIIALFQWNLRLKRRMEDWGRYFVVRRGVSQRIRETIGLLNGRVGYVYLVDEECRIRWAGSADAEGTEVSDLTRGAKRLIDEASGVTKTKIEPPAESADDIADARSESLKEKDEKGLPIPVPIAFK